MRDLNGDGGNEAVGGHKLLADGLDVWCHGLSLDICPGKVPRVVKLEIGRRDFARLVRIGHSKHTILWNVPSCCLANM